MNQNTNVTEKRSDLAASDAALLPPVDVIEDAGGITLFADLPGVSKDTLKLQLETDSLTIEGDVALNLPQEMESSYAEVKVPRYRRIFTLSKDLDGEKTSAELKNGVLKLRIPKAAHAQPRKIQISVG
jgi:HSP20 family protein